MHVEIYTINGRRYKYEVTNYRAGNRVKHKKKYLGPLEPINKTERRKSTGRKPTIFVHQLTSDEQASLEAASRTNNAFTKERARVILYSSQGLKVSGICKKMGKEKRSVLAAVKKFNEKGLACLQRGKTTGRKPKFTDEQRAKIIEVINTDPRNLGKNFTSWSLPKLKAHAIENNIVERISIETLRQVLHRGNKRYKKSRKWLFSNDPNFSKKNF